MTSADSKVTMGMYKGFYVSLVILFYNFIKYDLALNNIASNTVSTISINMNEVVKIIHLLCNLMIIVGTGLNDEIGFKIYRTGSKNRSKKTIYFKLKCVGAVHLHGMLKNAYHINIV